VAAIACLAAAPLRAQAPEPDTRIAVIEQQQAQKSTELHPDVPNGAEKYLDYAETYLTTSRGWHPFFESALSGGGFTLGAGHMTFVGPYNTFDVRGSLTPSGYKRLEAEYAAPRLLNRRGSLSVIAGWREAPQVRFHGIGTNTPAEPRVQYAFEQPYAAATFTFRPVHRNLLLRGGFEASQWDQEESNSDEPSVEDVYTPETLPGLGAKVTYLHSQATAGIDTRPGAGYARRGGFYGVTFHDYTDRDAAFGFKLIDYEVIQHVPILRESWVLSFRGAASVTGSKDDQEIPFFMLPAVGGGSSLRGYSSWRFRDRNSLELQAEWRVMVSRFLDLAFFYDAGKVTAHTRDLNLKGLKDDFGVGVRFHGPLSTPLRIELARSSEGTTLVFAASAVF
jgi:hypothetical protein